MKEYEECQRLIDTDNVVELKATVVKLCDIELTNNHISFKTFSDKTQNREIIKTKTKRETLNHNFN